MSHDPQPSSGIAPEILERLDPRAAVHPDYILGFGDEEVKPTCLVSDWVSFVHHDYQHLDQAFRIRRRDLEDFIKIQAQENDPYAPKRVMPHGYWVIDNSPETDSPSPTGTRATLILQYKTFRIYICRIEEDVVIGTADVDQILSSCLEASSSKELPSCIGSILYEDQVVHWLVVPALILYPLSSPALVEETRLLGNLPTDLDAHELQYNFDSPGIMEVARLREDQKDHLVSSLKAKLTPELRKAHKASIRRGLQIKLYSALPALEWVENYRSYISESDRHTPAVDNGQAVLSRQPHSLIGHDPYAGQQNVWTNIVDGPLQRGWPEGNPQALSVSLGYGVQAAGDHPTSSSYHLNCPGPSSLYDVQRDPLTSSVAYPRNTAPATTVRGGHKHSSAEAEPLEYWDPLQTQQHYDDSHHSGQYSSIMEEEP